MTESKYELDFALLSRATLVLALFEVTREPHPKSPPPAGSVSLKRDLQSVYLLECSERNTKSDCSFRAAKDSPAAASLRVLFCGDRRLADGTITRFRVASRLPFGPNTFTCSMPYGQSQEASRTAVASAFSEKPVARAAKTITVSGWELITLRVCRALRCEAPITRRRIENAVTWGSHRMRKPSTF